MSDQTQRSGFRFRLPWRQASETQPPAPPRRSTTTTTTTNTASPASPVPENRDSNQSTQRPPFRPAGKAPVQGSSQASRTEPKNEPKPSSSPSLSRTESKTEPKPSSSPSPSRTEPKPSSSSSPSRTEPKPSSSPSPSPSHSLPRSRPTTPSSSPNHKPTGAPFPVSDKDSQTPLKTEPEPVESQPKPENVLDTAKEAEPQQPETTTQPYKELETATPATDLTGGQQTVATTDKQESKPSSGSNLEEAKEVIRESGMKDKVETKEQQAVAFQPEKEQNDNKERSSKEQMVKASDSDGQQTKPVTSHPRSKLTLTDSNQKLTISKEKLLPRKKDIKESSSSSDLVQTGAVGTKQSSEERPVNVITLAGDNRGASMQLGSDSSTKERSIPIHRGYKSNPDTTVEATTEAESSSRGRKPEDQKTIRDREVNTYVNCNIQGMNNSLLLNSSLTERSPGVNVEIPLIPTEHVKSDNKAASVVTRRAEFNTTPAQKLTYEPKVRRRCLKGLFLESGDSDVDNPEKPHRHGCRVGCKEEPKENN